MTKNEFEALLSRLDPDRERAGENYEQIRSKLVTFFRGRGVTRSEDAGDEVLDRVARRVLAGGVLEVMAFIWGVARKVASEDPRERTVPINEETDAPVDPIDIAEEQRSQVLQRCLHSCLALLDPDERGFMEEYYLYEGREKIENRKRLADRRQTTLERLKVQAFRVRKKLRRLVDECVKRTSFGELAAAVN